MPETVLVVDDHPLVLTTLVCTLLHAGFQVLSASSGGEALAVASRPGQRIDLLVCDLILPDMPGTDLASRVSELHPHMRYLYITGLPIIRESPRTSSRHYCPSRSSRTCWCGGHMRSWVPIPGR